MNDKDIYLSLKNICTVLYNLYRKLKKLELNHKENSKEYEEILKAIDYYKKTEDAICYIVCKSNNQELMLGLAADATLEMCGKNLQDRLIHDPHYIINNKIKEKDLICMRISARMHDIYIHHVLRNDDSHIEDVFDIFFPQKTKYFLDLLTEQSNSSDFKDYREMLIDAKYDYAFVNFKESISKDIEDKKIINANSARNYNEIIEYADKYSKLNKATLLYPKNTRRFLLGIDYIRANLIQMEESNINDLKNMIDYILFVSESYDTNIEKDGLNAFNSILSFASEDKEKYDKDDFSFRRRF